MPPDWTVPYDDLITLRFTACIVCAGAAQRLELRSTATGFARTMAVCHRCLRDKGIEDRLQALVEAHDPQRARAV